MENEIKSFEDLGAQKIVSATEFITTLQAHADEAASIDSQSVLGIIDRTELTIDQLEELLRAAIRARANIKAKRVMQGSNADLNRIQLRKRGGAVHKKNQYEIVENAIRYKLAKLRDPEYPSTFS